MDISNKLSVSTPNVTKIHHLKDYYTTSSLSIPMFHEFELKSNNNVINTDDVQNKIIKYIRIDTDDNISFNICVAGMEIFTIHQHNNEKTEINLPPSYFYKYYDFFLQLDIPNVDYKCILEYYDFDFPESYFNDITIFDHDDRYYNNTIKILSTNNNIEIFPSENNIVVETEDTTLLTHNINGIDVKGANVPNRINIINTDLGFITYTEKQNIENKCVEMLTFNDKTYYLLKYDLKCNNDIIMKLTFTNAQDIISCQIKFNKNKDIQVANIDLKNNNLSLYTTNNEIELFVTIEEELLNNWLTPELYCTFLHTNDETMIITGQNNAKNGDIIQTLLTL